MFLCLDERQSLRGSKPLGLLSKFAPAFGVHSYHVRTELDESFYLDNLDLFVQVLTRAGVC